MKIYLLTHQREQKKSTNTGRIVKDSLDNGVEIHIWKRTEPPREILELIERDEILLLYPDGDDRPANSLTNFENFLILDGTWQETRKIYNRSPYLQRASRGSLEQDLQSRFVLRRNQRVGGLSTAECAIELLMMKDRKSLAEKVRVAFDCFNAEHDVRGRGQGDFCGV